MLSPRFKRSSVVRGTSLSGKVFREQNPPNLRALGTLTELGWSNFRPVVGQVWCHKNGLLFSEFSEREDDYEGTYRDWGDLFVGWDMFRYFYTVEVTERLFLSAGKYSFELNGFSGPRMMEKWWIFLGVVEGIWETGKC